VACGPRKEAGGPINSSKNHHSMKLLPRQCKKDQLDDGVGINDRNAAKKIGPIHSPGNSLSNKNCSLPSRHRQRKAQSDKVVNKKNTKLNKIICPGSPALPWLSDDRKVHKARAPYV
jgi:hypothetical protein